MIVLEPISKLVISLTTVTLAKAGVHLNPLSTWIPAFARMTTFSVEPNFEIGYSNLNPQKTLRGLYKTYGKFYYFSESILTDL
jgi:hypothetical protein